MGSPNDETQQQTEALANQGYEFLDEEEYEKALEVARKLEELHYTAAFEIAALAHDGMGNLDEAVRVLHRGVDVAPDCWPNWQLLGNYLSDLERYEEAEASYEQALQCKKVWEPSIRLNQAILAGRRDQYEKALELLEHVDSPELALRVAEHQIVNLNHLGRTDEALTQATQVLAENRDNEEQRESLGRIAATLGQIRRAAGDDKEELRAFALTWLEVDPISESLFELLRDLDGLFADAVQYYWLFLHAELPADHPLAADVAGYFVSYGVIAESAQEALEFARRLEEDDLAPLLEIEEIQQTLEVEPSEPKGVCRRTGRSFYESEE